MIRRCCKTGARTFSQIITPLGNNNFKMSDFFKKITKNSNSIFLIRKEIFEPVVVESFRVLVYALYDAVNRRDEVLLKNICEPKLSKLILEKHWDPETKFKEPNNPSINVAHIMKYEMIWGLSRDREQNKGKYKKIPYFSMFGMKRSLFFNKENWNFKFHKVLQVDTQVTSSLSFSSNFDYKAWSFECDYKYRNFPAVLPLEIDAEKYFLPPIFETRKITRRKKPEKPQIDTLSLLREAYNSIKSANRHEEVASRGWKIIDIDYSLEGNPLQLCFLAESLIN